MSDTHDFEARFGCSPEAMFFAPGRINLIGEHIDYCGGLVMPMAIDCGTRVLASRNQRQDIRIYSERFGEQAEIPLSASQPRAHWSDFAVGICHLMSRQRPLTGVDIYVSDTIEAGGLSSSASFSLALAHCMSWACDQKLESVADKLSMARLCQQVEHEFIGVQCGIMDQASIALGGVMALNCADLSFEALPHDFADCQIVVMDTRHPRKLAGSKYNERVIEIEQIREHLVPGFDLQHLCDLKDTELEAASDIIPEAHLKRRLRHVVTENARVSLAALALKQGDMTRLGQLMNDSHRSLQEDYEVTGKALDTIVSISQSQAGCLGARMTGAGFGGCALSLVARDHVAAHNDAVSRGFEAATGVEPVLFSVVPAGPAARVYDSL